MTTEEITCTHLDAVDLGAQPSGDGCVECLETGGRWVHLRMCRSCGHIGCCDNSPGLHATKHSAASGHPLISSFEPGESWWWCYFDEVDFDVADAPDYSHP